MPDAPEKEKLLVALGWHDENSRQTRAKRIKWASPLYQSPGLVSGEIIPLNLRTEAYDCFVNGQFLATILCAAATIEHLLVDDLQARELAKNWAPLGRSIEIVRKHRLFPAEIIDQLVRLNELRNPIAHRRDALDSSTFANRYLENRIHPSALMEKDAKFALEVMCEFFQLVLKPSAQ